MTALRLLLVALCAAAAPSGPTSLPRAWAEVSVPDGWRAVAEGLWSRGQGPQASTLSVAFRPGEDVMEWLRRKAEPSAAQRRALRLTAVDSGSVEYRGPWAIVSGLEVEAGGARRRVLHAALPAPGGLYSVDATASESDWPRVKAEAGRLLDGFRRETPPLTFEPLEVKGAFALSAPAGSWTRSGPDADADARVIAPRGPGGGAPGMLTVKAAAPAQADALLRQLCPGAAPVARRARAGILRLAESRLAPSGETPEADAASAAPLRTRCAVLDESGRSFVIAWMARPESYEYGLPAFQRAVESLVPER